MEPNVILFWIAAVTAAVLVGLSKGGLPVVGMLATPVLALFMPPVAAAGLLLPVFVVSDAFGLWAYRREYSARNLAILVPATTLGVALGWATAAIVAEQVITGLVGLIGLAFSLSLLLRRGTQGDPRPAALGPGIFWGAVTGFTSFVSHAGAPPYQVFVQPQRLDKTIFAGTTTILFAYVNAIKLVPYWALGQLSAGNLKAAAMLLLPAALAVLAGVRLVRIISQDLFFRLVTWALLAVSLKLLWDAAAAS
jgi:hypothetical protein